MTLPQVSLRELFLLVAIAAIGCGWWVERGQLQTNHRLEILRIKEEWASQRDDLIRKQQAEKLLISLERNEAKVLLDVERRKANP